MTDLIPIAAQAPIVAIFAWYAYQNNKNWQSYLAARNSKLETAIDKLSDAIHSLNK